MRAFACLLAVLVLSACTQENNDYPPPNLAPTEVISAANLFLAEQDIDIVEYRLETLGFNYVTRTWHLQFEGESGVLHDYYWLVVQDDNISEISVSGR